MTTESGRWYRFGFAFESAAALEVACEVAIRNGFPHGVSVLAAVNRAASSAERAQVALYFPVRKTGRNDYHYTLELPHPVTIEVAERFNRLFGRVTDHGTT